MSCFFFRASFFSVVQLWLKYRPFRAPIFFQKIYKLFWEVLGRIKKFDFASQQASEWFHRCFTEKIKNLPFAVTNVFYFFHYKDMILEFYTKCNSIMKVSHIKCEMKVSHIKCEHYKNFNPEILTKKLQEF